MIVEAFDIETGPVGGKFDESTVKFGSLKDPVKKERKIIEAMIKWEQNQALNPETGEILLIVISDGHSYFDFYGDEAEMLGEVWDHFRESLDRGNRLVGHNCFGFDLPFMMKRSYIHGLSIPIGIYNHLYRRWGEHFVDTMKLWTLGAYQEFITLDKLDRLFGGPGVGKGKKFKELWERDQQKAIEYCHGDVDATLRVSKQMGVYSL